MLQLLVCSTERSFEKHLCVDWCLVVSDCEELGEFVDLIVIIYAFLALYEIGLYTRMPIDCKAFRTFSESSNMKAL